jgi:hypothetical protein
MIEHVLHTVQVKDMVLAAFELNYFHHVVKLIETYGTLRCLSKEDVAKWKMSHVLDEFSLPPPGPFVARHELVTLQHSNCEDEEQDGADDNEDAKTHHRSKDQ